jgi:putative Ca2+/H+ antiporter (TMEM165/GDT1 family)
VIGVSIGFSIISMIAASVAIYGAAKYNRMAVLVGAVWYVFTVLLFGLCVCVCVCHQFSSDMISYDTVLSFLQVHCRICSLGGIF